MRAKPEGLEVGSVVDALRRGWGFHARDAEYAAVGGGSYSVLYAVAGACAVLGAGAVLRVKLVP